MLDIEEEAQPLWETVQVAELHGLTVSDAEGERDCEGEMDWQPEEVNEEVKQPLSVEHGVLDTVEDGQPLWVPLTDAEPQGLTVSEDEGERDCEGEIDWQPEGVKEEEKQPLSVEQGVLDTDEDEQPLWVPLQDVELQGLTVNDEEVERDCEGEAVKLCVEVTQRVTVEEMDWQPEAEYEEEKQLLDVKLSVAVAQRDCVKDIDGQPEAVYEEEKHPLSVEHGVLDIEEL